MTAAPAVPRRSPARRQQRLCESMAAWVLDGSHRDTVAGSIFADEPTVSATDPAEMPDDGWSVSALLVRLWNCPDRLPAPVTDTLALPRGTTVGQAAQLLWWLRRAPRFGCRSYASAIETLRSLDRATFRELYGRVTARSRLRARP